MPLLKCGEILLASSCKSGCFNSCSSLGSVADSRASEEKASAVFCGLQAEL